MTGAEHDRLMRTLAVGGAFGQAVARGGARLVRTLLHWQELERQRRQLLEMDGRTLKDIGLTRWQAHRLASRIARDEFNRLFRDRL